MSVKYIHLPAFTKMLNQSKNNPWHHSISDTHKVMWCGRFVNLRHRAMAITEPE